MYGEVTDLENIKAPQPGDNVKLTIDAEYDIDAVCQKPFEIFVHLCSVTYIRIRLQRVKK